MNNNTPLFFPATFPIIDSCNEYFLREQSVEDAESFLSYYSDPSVSRYILAEIPSTVTEAKNEVLYCRELFYAKTGIYWSLANKKTNLMIGAIGLYVRSTHTLEICYDLDKQYWRQGIMTKALSTVINYAATTMKAKELFAITMKENTASILLLEKLGFKHHQSLEASRYHKGVFYTVEKYTLPLKAKK